MGTITALDMLRYLGDEPAGTDAAVLIEPRPPKGTAGHLLDELRGANRRQPVLGSGERAEVRMMPPARSPQAPMQAAAPPQPPQAPQAPPAPRRHRCPIRTPRRSLTEDDVKDWRMRLEAARDQVLKR